MHAKILAEPIHCKRRGSLAAPQSTLNHLLATVKSRKITITSLIGGKGEILKVLSKHIDVANLLQSLALNLPTRGFENTLHHNVTIVIPNKNANQKLKGFMSESKM